VVSVAAAAIRNHLAIIAAFFLTLGLDSVADRRDVHDVFTIEWRKKCPIEATLNYATLRPVPSFIPRIMARIRSC
jgi:hypothetical protein